MNFTIEYKIQFTDRSDEYHTTKVKNCMDELHAKIKLGDYIKRKYPNHTGLSIITCDKDFMDAWNDLFGNTISNPFNF